jgi:hypothetical protein
MVSGMEAGMVTVMDWANSVVVEMWMRRVFDGLGPLIGGVGWRVGRSWGWGDYSRAWDGDCDGD